MIKEKQGKINGDLPEQRYVIFFCDECALLDPIIVIHRRLHPDIDVLTFTDAEKLVEQVTISRPVLILAYLNNPENDYISFIKFIRQNVESAAVPVVVYKTLPTESEIARLMDSNIPR